jgi:hypothetical protein
MGRSRTMKEIDHVLEEISVEPAALREQRSDVAQAHAG